MTMLLAPLGGKAEAPQHPMSPSHVRLQHIRQVHEANGRNVSATARRLNMHRRTLQRILTRQAGKWELRFTECEQLGSSADP
jgi:two-component system, response regulator RegA